MHTAVSRCSFLAHALPQHIRPTTTSVVRVTSGTPTSVNHKMNACVPTACCQRCRRLTSSARINQPQWHYHNQSRRVASYRASSPKIATPSSRFSMLIEMGLGPFSCAWQRNYFTSATTTTGKITSNHGARYMLNYYGVKYNIIQQLKQASSHDHCRFFTSAQTPQNSEPTNPLHKQESSQLDSLDDIKSKVESETDQVRDDISDETKIKVESDPDGVPEQLRGNIRKTQDDFADYLKGEEHLLHTETGVLVNKKDFVESELKSNSMVSSPLEYTSGNPSEDVLHPSVAPPPELSHSYTVANSHGPDNKTAETNPAGDLQTDYPNTNYQYIFTPKDATLSGRERFERRRRAMEQKLEEQQAQSRATTHSNVQRALAGNAVIAVAKLAASISSGSSAMMSEFVHSVVDCGNQALLLVGLSTSSYAPDRTHPYGYGKAIYFWALVSALGTFFLGAGVSMTHAVGELMNPHMTTEVPWEVWGVLGMSFAVDGYVFSKTVQGVMASKRIDGDSTQMSFWKYATTKIRDPATLAVLLEDGAACLGVVIAIGGIGMTQYTGLPVCDAVAGMCISGLLGAMGLALVQVNHRFLIGQGLDKATREDIEKIILSRRSIDNIFSVQSQWTGPDTFSYKAEVDFDGTFLAAKLMPRYQQEFFDAKDTLDRDLRVLLSWYAEDVMRAAEREIRHIEEEIRTKHPAAQYIELEPMSKDADRYAIDDGMEAQLRRVEVEVLNRYLKSLYKSKEGGGDKE
ncbi:hypothetical protein HJC23_006479 [Cyclotella cryptica]|uniref:Cation efflux protein transmembrane domain-containing protein n=1 Tax=Cyclotella cryptica TaxID=29204 RepID=A0ABD3QV57_9STRA|eukprot:CCRYP_001911-RA/>CCRYP_001911-RA protein AED:0.15 eAED:0.15 QI:314/-1/1/1/-1/1/1/91/744